MTGTGAGPEPRVVNLWCGPRTVSTAMMYSWRQRADTLVFDEPFYGIYLRRFDPGHPDREAIIAAMPLDIDATVAHICRPAPEPVRFIKNIGHHLDALPTSILDLFTNALLIRVPEQVIASLAARLDGEISLTITGLPQQVAILDHELAAGRRPVVVDAARLLADPPAVLEALCVALDVPWDDAMLAWPPGPKPEDGVWAPHWYGSVHRSTGFTAPKGEPIAIAPAHERLLETCRPLYERLLAHHLRA